MDLLITGGTGLLGHALKIRGLDNARFIGRKDVDLTDFQATKTAFDAWKPKRVIHLAAAVGGIGANLVHPGETYRNNILINTNILECSRLVGVEKLISFMSTCIFPERTQHPLRVADLHNGPPHQSNFGYAYAKRMLEVQSRAYRQQWDCNFIVAIPTNIYGPNDHWNLEEGHVIPSLIHKTFLANEQNRDLVVWGTGKPLREFLYSLDLARLVTWLLDEYDDPTPIILSAGEEISIRQIVHMITEQMDFQGEVIFDEMRPDGQFRKPSDNSQLLQLLPRFQFTSLKDGIRQTVDWFLENYPNIRT